MKPWQYLILFLFGCIIGLAGVALGNAALPFMIMIFMVLISWGVIFFLQVKNKDLLEVGPVLIISYLLYNLSYPLFMSFSGQAFITDYIKYTLISALGLIGLIMGYLFATKVVCLKMTLPTFTEKDIKSSLWILGFFALGSLVTFFKAFGGLKGYLNTKYGGEYWKVIINGGILGSGFEWLGILLVLIYIFLPKRLPRILALGALTLWSLMSLAVGGRGRVINILLILVILWWYVAPQKLFSKRKKWPVASFWLLLILGYVLAQFIGISREYLYLGMAKAVAKGWAIVSQSPDLFLPWRWGEFIMPGGALQELISHEGEWSLRYGVTYLEALGYIVPGLYKLLSYSFIPLSVWRMQMFHPIEWAQGRGLGFSAVAEGYANWGYFGAFFHLLFLGMFAGFLYKTVKNNRSNTAIVLYALSFPTLVLTAIRMDTTWLWTYTHAYLWPMVLIYFLHIFRDIFRRGREAVKA